MEREGRGRLSKIDMLPEAADEDIVWANAQLRAGKMSQKEILLEFNARLSDKGIGSISVGSFSRYSTAKAEATRAMEKERRMAADVIEMLGAKGSDEQTIYLSELIKTQASQILHEGVQDATTLAALARAHNTAVKSMILSRQLREQMEKKVEQAKEAVIDRVASEGGLSKERIAQLRKDFLGVKPGGEK